MRNQDFFFLKKWRSSDFSTAGTPLSQTPAMPRGSYHPVWRGPENRERGCGRALDSPNTGAPCRHCCSCPYWWKIKIKLPIYGRFKDDRFAIRSELEITDYRLWLADPSNSILPYQIRCSPATCHDINLEYTSQALNDTASWNDIDIWSQ